MKGIVRTLLTILAALLGLVLALVLAYAAYMQLTYYRIEDNTPQELRNPATNILKRETDYTALTFNIGFGAYNQDFNFFMDTGVMEDGTPVRGTMSRAQSPEIAMENTLGALSFALDEKADFYLFQEVDQKATRSHNIDQKALIQEAAEGYASTYALNFHSAYLMYPFTEPHGSVQSGLLSLSRYAVTEAVRRSFPVDPAFPTKFFDLDRCFTLMRLPVEEDKELVLMNAHLSAYDKGGAIRAAQLEMLNGVLTEEYEKGNYVIVGGDFNHALWGTIISFPSQQQRPSWVFSLESEDLAPGFGVVRADNINEVATCRGSDLPYVKGVNYSVVVDGFIVSDNVTARAENLDADFRYSDHNPVRLTFSLN